MREGKLFEVESRDGCFFSNAGLVYIPDLEPRSSVPNHHHSTPRSASIDKSVESPPGATLEDGVQSEDEHHPNVPTTNQSQPEEG